MCTILKKHHVFPHEKIFKLSICVAKNTASPAAVEAGSLPLPVGSLRLAGVRKVQTPP